jgi:regulator of chromosome condensation
MVSLPNKKQANDGILGFRQDVKVQSTPMLVPELKNVTSIACGTNHVLAITKNGKCFTWGAGEQSQLARRVVARTASGALVPREFGLGRKKVVRVGCGDYHSFAVDDKGDVYSWGLNSFGQTGVSKSKDAENDSIGEPTKVDILKGFELQQITGGAHHTLACTKKGEVLVWGRIDNKQGGMDVSKIPKDHIFFDENEKPRYLIKPLVIPDIKGAYVATGVDTCIAVDDGGKAYSWGFSTNYQTGQGSDEDVAKARHIDNTAVRGKKLVFAGVGGQFGVLGGIHEEAVLTNGV